MTPENLKSIELAAGSKTAEDTSRKTTSAISSSSVQVYKGTFCNYFSIGMTARGAMEFHKERESHPKRFTGPMKNKVIYAQKGCGMVCGDCFCHQSVAGRVALKVAHGSLPSRAEDRGSQVEDGKGRPALKDVDLATHLCEINVLNIRPTAVESSGHHPSVERIGHQETTDC